MYFGTRSIISYVDLESELVQMLRSFSYPSITSYCQHSSSNQRDNNLNLSCNDPNEIDIDGFGGDSAVLPTEISSVKLKSGGQLPKYFVDYGLGNLFQHPTVSMYLFDGIDTDERIHWTPNFITSADLLHSICSIPFEPEFKNLMKFRNKIDYHKESSNIFVENLEFALCEWYEVSSLLEIGIIIAGNLEIELLAIQHVKVMFLDKLFENLIRDLFLD